MEPESAYTELAEVANSARNKKTDYHGVCKYIRTPSEQEIIQYVGGGDKTKGSCASLGFAYLCNRAGFEVLDYRGGTSQDLFSIDCTKILRKMGAHEEKNVNDIKASKVLLSEVQEGREYYFISGRHAAVVRKHDGRLQYLELQNATENGWKDFTSSTLKERFKCRMSHSIMGMKYEDSSFIIDGEDLVNNPEFLSLMGYINTAQNKQKKGGGGRAK